MYRIKLCRDVQGRLIFGNRILRNKNTIKEKDILVSILFAKLISVPITLHHNEG